MLRKLVSIFAYIITLSFILIFLYRASSNSFDFVEIKYLPIILFSISLIFLAFYIQLHAWKLSISHAGNKINFSQTSYLFCVAVLTAYIPGKIPGLLITATSAKKFGQSPIVFGLGVFNFQILSISIVFFLSCIFMSILLSINIDNYFFLLTILILIIYVTLLQNSKILNIILNFVLKKLNLDTKYNVKFTNKILFKIANLFILCWLLISFSFVTLAYLEIVDFNVSNILKLIIIFLIGYFLGVVSIIFPSGLGVFEVIIYFGLQNLLTEPTALAIALFTRIIMILPACLTFLTYKVYFLMNKKSDRFFKVSKF